MAPTAIPAFAPALSVEGVAGVDVGVEERLAGREDAVAAVVETVLAGFDEVAEDVDGELEVVVAAEEEVVWLTATNLAFTSPNSIAC